MNSNNVDQLGRTELHYAVAEKDLGKVKALIKAKADINKQDKQGWTPLHFAAQENALLIAELLIEAGALINIQDEYGNTPLFRAVFNSRGNGDLIKLLRSRGADPYAANKSGQTPLGLARLVANYPVAQFFADLPE